MRQCEQFFFGLKKASLVLKCSESFLAQTTKLFNSLFHKNKIKSFKRYRFYENVPYNNDAVNVDFIEQK